MTRGQSQEGAFAYQDESASVSALGASAHVDLAAATQRLEQETDTAVLQADPDHAAAQQFWIPNDVWRITAGFSSRADVLSLRTTSRELKAQLDLAVTSVTLRGPDDLLSFIAANSFLRVKDMQLVGPSDAALQALITHLAAHPRLGLTLSLSGNDPALQRPAPIDASAETLRRISALPLNTLQLYVSEAGSGAVVSRQLAALVGCRYGVELFAPRTMHRLELIAASNLPTLTRLEVRSARLTEEVTDRFAGHPALQVLHVNDMDGATNPSIEALATIPTLCELRIGGVGKGTIEESAAMALAKLPVLATLELTNYARLPEAAFAFLARIKSLRTLTIRYQPAMRELANMVSLTRLSLDVQFERPYEFDPITAATIAGLPKLETFELHLLKTADPDTVGALCRNSAFRKFILFIGSDLHEAVLAVLVANTRLTELTIHNFSNVSGFSQHTVDTLRRHPTLYRLTVVNDNMVFERVADESALMAVQA